MKLIWKGIAGVLGAGVVIGGVTAFVVVNQKNDVNVKEANQDMYPNKIIDKTKQPNNAKKIKYDEKDIRVASWNLKNFLGSSSRIKAMSQIIADQKIALLGAQEVDKASALYDLAKELNSQTKTTSWKVIASALSKDGKTATGLVPMGGVGTWEYYGFVYNSDVINPKAFSDSKKSIGLLYENEYKENPYLKGMTGATNTKSAYTRPPFGTQFQYKNGKDFTAVIAHFDSPKGGKAHVGHALAKNTSSGNATTTFEGSLSSTATNNKYGTSVGTQELFEAEQTKNVMDWFKTKNGGDNDMIFMGDTNIGKMKNGSPFKLLTDDKYKELFDPSSDASKTSLARYPKTRSVYSNPYDKIFSNSPLVTSGKKFDMTTALNIIDANTKKDLWVNKLSDLPKISDHTMVYATFDFSKGENGKSNSKTATLPKRKVDINTANFYDLTSVYGFKETEAMQIIHYRKLVGKIDENALRTLIDYFVKGGKKINKVEEMKKKYSLDFIYSSTPPASNIAKIRRAGDYKSGLGHDITLEKVDINAMTYAQLLEKVKLGVISQKTLEMTMMSRSKGQQILDKSVIDSNGKYGINESDDKLIDYSNSVVKIENPLDINGASAATMLKYLVGYDSLYGLSEYHVWALIAARDMNGSLNYKKLESAIGKYAKGKLGYNIDYKGALNTTKVFTKKLDINKLTQKDFEKYLGKKIGGNVYSFIMNKALKDTPNFNGISSLDELKKADPKYYYWLNEAQQFLTVDKANLTFDEAKKASANTVKKYTVQELKTELAKVGVTATKYKSSLFTPKKAELHTLRDYLMAHLGPVDATNKDVLYFIKNNKYLTFLKHLVIEMNANNNVWKDVVANWTYSVKSHPGGALAVLKIIAPQ